MRINVDSNEFADIVASFLFDKLLYPDKVVANNDLFNDFMEKMNGKGAKSILMQYYLNLSTDTRVNYKRIKDVFKDGNKTHEIRISSEEQKENEKEKSGLVRKAVKIVKKLLKKEEVSIEELNLLLETIEEE